MSTYQPHEQREHDHTVATRRRNEPEHAVESGHHAPTADNRQAPRPGSQDMAMLHQHYAAHRAAQRAAEDGLHFDASAHSLYVHLVDQDLARHDYVGAIQAMNRDPDVQESQRLAATITSHLDAHLSSLSMYDLLRTLHDLDTHGCLGQIQAALIDDAAGLTQERLAFASAVLAFGVDALEDPRPRYLSDHAADYEGAVTYLQLSAHPTPSRSSQLVDQDLARGNVIGAFQVMNKDSDRTERLYLLEMILHRLEDWLGQRSMYDLLRTLGPLKAQGYLDQRSEWGDTFQTLLVNAAAGLNKDRLAYALTVLARGAEFVNDETQPSYIAQHYEDLHGAQAYLRNTSTEAPVVLDEPLDPREHIYSEWLEGLNNDYSSDVELGIASAVSAVGYDPVLYDAWWTDLIGLAIAGAGCLVPGLSETLTISSTAVGSALQAVSALPSLSGPQMDFAQRVAANVGGKAHHDEHSAWLHIANRIRGVVHSWHQVATKERWGHYQLQATLIQQFWKPEFVQINGGGLVNLNGGAVQDKTTRDLLLAAVDKKGVGGHLVYEYTATNVFRTENLEGMAGAVYNRPEEWHYTPGRVVLAVAPQLVAALTNQQQTQPIVSGDVTAPATIVVTTPSIVGSTDFRAALHLDDKDNVTGLSPRPEYWWDGQEAAPVEAPEGEWAQAMRTSAWLSSGSDGGARPQVPVGAVAQESWNL